MPASDRHAKTEAPTPKRKKEARDRGQVARSPDLVGWAAILLGSFLVPWIIGSGEKKVLAVTASAANVMAHPTVPGAVDVTLTGLRDAFVTVLPVGAIFMALGLFGGAAQVGGGFSLKAMAPKFSRISPKEGIKRLFSPQTTFSLAKQIAKLAALGFLGYRGIYGLMHAVPSTVPISTATSIGIAGGAITSFVRSIALIGFGVGIADYIFQRHRLGTALKMTKDEVKEENRQSQGDPTMKAEIRKRGYQIARSRVLAATRTADVVIANPSHYAVALQYDSGAGGAPRVVAKGSDALALRIRAEAGQYRVPVVEDPPLARYLYAACEIGQQIPGEIYVAVARLLAFVYSLPESVRGVMVHHRAPSIVPFDPGSDAGLASTRRSFQAGTRERVGANR